MIHPEENSAGRLFAKNISIPPPKCLDGEKWWEKR